MQVLHNLATPLQQAHMLAPASQVPTIPMPAEKLAGCWAM